MCKSKILKLNIRWEAGGLNKKQFDYPSSDEHSNFFANAEVRQVEYTVQHICFAISYLLQLNLFSPDYNSSQMSWDIMTHYSESNVQGISRIM